MSFEVERVFASKRALRQKLRGLPVAEKLRLLDELRASALALRRASVPAPPEPDMVAEGQTAYRAKRRTGKSA